MTLQRMVLTDTEDDGGGHAELRVPLGLQR